MSSKSHISQMVLLVFIFECIILKETFSLRTNTVHRNAFLIMFFDQGNILLDFVLPCLLRASFSNYISTSLHLKDSIF